MNIFLLDHKNYLFNRIFFELFLLHNFLLFEGLSLCGAGAGGFAVVILKEKKNRADLFAKLNEFTSQRTKIEGNDFNKDLSISSIIIDTKGISTKEFHETQQLRDAVDDRIKSRKLADYLFL